MADRITKEQRSKNMSAVRGKGNKSTELRLVQLFKESGITGWRRHLKNIPGKPDFSFPKERIAVFVDGCFWHGCRKCSNLQPETNKKFWEEKVARNKIRDQKVNQTLRRSGWKVVRIWEHEIQVSAKNKINKIYDKCRSK